MRKILPLSLVALSIAVLPACDILDAAPLFDSIFDDIGGQPVDLSHQSRALSPTASSFIEAKGIALRDHGEVAFVGMADMICEVSQMRGNVTVDYDPDPERPERVVGQSFTHIIAVSPDHVHILPLDRDDWRTRHIPGVLDADTRDDGWVALVDDEDGCHLRYQRYGQGSTTTDLPDDACDNGNMVAPDDTAEPIFIATPWGVYAVQPDGSVIWKSDPPDPRLDVTPLVAWYGPGRVLAVAIPGSQRVSLYDEHGTTLHHVSVGAEVIDLGVAAADGGFSVLVRHRDQSSEVVIVSPDGSTSSALTSPSTLDRMWTSPEGLRWAFERRGEVHFFEHAHRDGAPPSGAQNQGL